jgi:hypothetical protein
VPISSVLGSPPGLAISRDDVDSFKESSIFPAGKTKTPGFQGEGGEESRHRPFISSGAQFSLGVEFPREPLPGTIQRIVVFALRHVEFDALVGRVSGIEVGKDEWLFEIGRQAVDSGLSFLYFQIQLCSPLHGIEPTGRCLYRRAIPHQTVDRGGGGVALSEASTLICLCPAVETQFC